VGALRVDRLEVLVARIAAAGGEAVSVGLDVKRRDDLVGLVTFACETFGRLDVLVNNAGISRISRFDDLRVEDWDEMIDVNFRGVLYGIAAALPVFRRARLRSRREHHLDVGTQDRAASGVYAVQKMPCALSPRPSSGGG